MMLRNCCYTLISVFLLLYTEKVQSGETKICLGYCETDCTCNGDGNYYQCKNGDCIDWKKYRDYRFDCTDKSDEDVECCSGQFLCDKKNGIGVCMDSEVLDNGVIDCIDGSDESNENFKTCETLRQAELEAGLTNTVYECKLVQNGATSPKCIPVSHLLDGNQGHADCPGGDDEDPAQLDECSLGIHECDRTNGICTNIPDGSYSCTCKEGYSGNGYTCIPFGNLVDDLLSG